MRKQDLVVIALLFVLMLAWPTIYKKFAPPPPTRPEIENNIIAEPLSAQTPSEPLKTGIAEPPAIVEKVEMEEEPDAPEKLLSISNNFLTITVSSRGGGIVSATLQEYRSKLALDSPPLVFDFQGRQSLSYEKLPGFSAESNFDITTFAKGDAIKLEKTNNAGIRFTRIISLQENYQIAVEDVLFNEGDQTIDIPQHSLRLGFMTQAESETKSSRQHNLGIDALLVAGGEGVKNWASKLPGFFKDIRKARHTTSLPLTIAITTNIPVEWVAAKDKFFVQILETGPLTTGYEMLAERKLKPGEGINPKVNPKNADIDKVAVSTILPSFRLEPQESFERPLKYYIGPKKLSILQSLGLHMDQIMEFGWWAPVCKILLRFLNAINELIPNYGLAIILVTILIRIIFWPLTHKSSQSMKKMQALQPEMKELQQKHKSNPKLMHAETMALYKKNKVNPLSGCLPMIIQIPVFIALFVVLRSAVELRFAPFLWIKDLSEPEGLLAHVLPIPLNILPIIMAATMVWQQKLMPTSDPNQQKMMTIFMPAIMLVMFYNMPSALVLYWSASQGIMIGQQLILKEKMANHHLMFWRRRK